MSWSRQRFATTAPGVRPNSRIAVSVRIGRISTGNPVETTVYELAEKIIKFAKSPSKIIHKPLPQDDPVRRRPDIGIAKDKLSWQPSVALDDGLERTVHFFRGLLAQ